MSTDEIPNARELLTSIRQAIIESCDHTGFGMHEYIQEEYDAVSEALGLPPCDEYGVPDELLRHPEGYELRLIHEGPLFYVCWGPSVEEMAPFEDGAQAALYYCKLKKEKDDALAKSQETKEPRLVREAKEVIACAKLMENVLTDLSEGRFIEKSAVQSALNFCQRIVECVEGFGREHLSAEQQLRLLLDATGYDDWDDARIAIATWRSAADKLASIRAKIS